MMPTATILVVEDDPDDQYLMLRAIKNQAKAASVQFIGRGSTAIELFVDESSSANFDLVLLDLNLPDLNGIEVLKAIRSNGVFDSLPIAVLSTSNYQVERQQAIKLGANRVLVKPNSLESLTEIFADLMASFIQQEGRND